MAETPTPADIVTRHREIREQYIVTLPDRLAALANAATRPAELAARAHALIGSASTFKLLELAAAARQLEHVARAQDDGAHGGAPALETALALVLRLGEQAASLPPLPDPDLVVPDLSDETLVYLLEDDPVQAGEMVVQLQPYGYTLVSFDDPDRFRAAVRQDRPAALLVDIICGDNPDAGCQTVAAMGAEGTLPPTIFLSSRDDFQARLGAVRAGGLGYLAKPVDPAMLAERLDQVIGRDLARPYRVLIIDDDEIVSAEYATAMGAAGMEVRTLSDAAGAVEAIRGFLPDLLVLDQRMPGCTGLELAAVLRQQEGMASLPILFLTAATELGDKRLALDVGAEDLLLKPVALPLLVTQVRARIRRARLLQAMMARDSLTGTLNHAMVQDHLVTEVARARREGKPLSFAMIDVDRFKRVNDEHGHAAGDRVLRALARLLRQRLRRSDIVGRYGGEEFAVVLPNTTAEEAALILDGLRRGFLAIGFRGADDALFHVSFSAGIAPLRPDSDVASLNLAADAALYFAKRAGRDRVHVAGSLSSTT
ncbi:diguanylate cyclase [Niveispirillum fermenti]|uniref:diguanylate cyclase n=1 Tax=Niveispirillum fermenti TaxID=1233113 RepID=UPI003A88E67F